MIKFVEYSGSKIIELMRKGGQDRCDQECLVCGGEKGGRCRSRGCVYQMWCRTCAANGVKSIYTGESGNCAHERANDHVKAFQSTNPEVRSKSVMWRHIDEVHGGDKEGIEFDMTVTDVFKDDPLGRQCMEGVKIRETVCDYVLNSKEEFRQPAPCFNRNCRRHLSSVTWIGHFMPTHIGGPEPQFIILKNTLNNNRI